MPDPAKSPAEEEPEASPASSSSIDELVAANDVDGLLALAKEARGKKDFAACVAAYRAAADLGSDEAEYAMALFHGAGVTGVVARDYAEMARRLRVAANRGHVPSKVYLANLYELGVHYAKDEEKADVWYRNAARSAKITAAPDGDEYIVAMAKLGAVRYCLAIIEAPETSAEDKDFYLKKAKAFGYQLHLRRESMTPTPPPSEAIATPKPAEAPAEKAKAPPDPVAQSPKKEADSKPKREDDPEERARAFARARYRKIAVAAFAYALFFTALGVGVGYLLLAGARELLAHGQTSVAIVGDRPERAMWIVYPLLGVLPTLMIYRGKTWLGAVITGVVVGFIGFVLSASAATAFVPLRWVQTMICFGAAFLVALFVLGLLGGAKPIQGRKST